MSSRLLHRVRPREREVRRLVAHDGAQLVEQADKICKDAAADRPKSAPELSSDPSKQDLQAAADYFQSDLDVTADTLDQLKELDPPEGLEDQWATVLAGFQAVVDDYPAMIDAAESGDNDQFISVVKQIQRDTVDLQPAAAEVGLEVCASPG